MDYIYVSLVVCFYYGIFKIIGLFLNYIFFWKNDDILIDDNFFCLDIWLEEII